MKSLYRLLSVWLFCPLVLVAWVPPITVVPATGRQGMVVAGHPEAVQAGLAVLQAGGNAMDAGVTVSLALGVAEPYGSGLGGKLMLLYYDAASGRTTVIDAMDAAGSVDVASYLQRPEKERSYGYGSVCVPGLAAGLWAAHGKWGRLPWAVTIAPAIKLAREGFTILPKTHVFFANEEAVLRAGDAEIARLYLPDGQLPVVGSRLANPDLARTLERFAAEGREGFYRGPVAEAILTAVQRGGGVITAADLAGYQARISEPVALDFRGYRLLAAPPPTHGAPLLLASLKVLEEDNLGGGPLRTATNLDRVGRVWREVYPLVQAGIGDVPSASEYYEKLVSPASIAALRAKAQGQAEAAATAGGERDASWNESAQAATTHFAVMDAEGNIVCATQSQSLHFGAGVVPPGTGVVLNDSMRNFDYREPSRVNYVAPGKRPRSTIAPLLVFHDSRPLYALGIPGSSRIPSALLQVLLDNLILKRPLVEAIGDTRIHFVTGSYRSEPDTIEAEESLPVPVVSQLEALGWRVRLREPAGTGIHFGGVNAIGINEDGSLSGLADPRRTNAALGY